MALKSVKNVTRISWGTVGSVAVGLALFGLMAYAVRMLPENAVTRPIKTAANVVTP
jgi:hypothetical protein